MKFAYLIEPLFNYRDENNNVTGCDVDLAKIILQKVGIQEFEAIEAEFADLLPGVNAGKWRMTTGLFATDERRKMVSFSKPIWALSDGLLVAKNNPYGLNGYVSIAQNEDCVLAVIRYQYQHRSAVELGIPESRIRLFDTYEQAATAVGKGLVSAYASVARAHTGYLEQNSGLQLEVVNVPKSEKQPEFGCFSCSLADIDFLDSVNKVLQEYLGSAEHRSLMQSYGFTQSEVDLVC